jgi:hypothetical protein
LATIHSLAYTTSFEPTAASGAFSTWWYIGAFPVGTRAVISGG